MSWRGEHFTVFQSIAIVGLVSMVFVVLLSYFFSHVQQQRDEINAGRFLEKHQITQDKLDVIIDHQNGIERRLESLMRK